MIIPAHLNFFKINECGLYKHGDKFAKALGSAETFRSIYRWLQDKPMEDTIPWDPFTTKSGSAKCYCHDFYYSEDDDDYVFVLWKSDSDGSGAIWGAQSGAQAGAAKVVEYKGNYKGKPVIWGRPCYYWIIPRLNTVVSVKVDHSVCDSGLFQEWITKCILNRVSHDNKKRTETETGQTRFEFTDGTDVPGSRYGYRFDMRLRTLNTENAHLQELASKVTHVIKRDTIKLNAGLDERPEWVKLFDKIPYLPVKPRASSRQIEVRAEAKPTPAEIKQIIETFAKDERKRSDWNNVGFATDKGDVWVDKYRLHESLNFSKEASTVFSASDIHNRISQHRDQLLKSVVVDEKKFTKKKVLLPRGSE